MRHALILVAVAGLLLFSGCTTPTPPTTIPPSPDGNGTTALPAIPTDLGQLHQHGLFEQYAASNGKTIQETREFFRQAYQIEEADIYAQLPAPPSTFAQDVNTLHYGNGLSINAIPRESYLQPEFYPTFSTSGIKTWVQAPEQFPNTYGVATTPADQQARVEEDSNGFSTTLYIGSAWGVTYYQGMAFRYTIEPRANIQLNFSPDHALLGPTFPVFTPEWVHQITIDGSIGDDVPAGEYTINIFPAEAPNEVQEAWYAEHPRYISGNGIIGPSNGLATFVLTIVRGNNPN